MRGDIDLISEKTAKEAFKLFGDNDTSKYYVQSGDDFIPRWTHAELHRMLRNKYEMHITIEKVFNTQTEKYEYVYDIEENDYYDSIYLALPKDVDDEFRLVLGEFIENIEDEDLSNEIFIYEEAYDKGLEALCKLAQIYKKYIDKYLEWD